MAVARRWIEFSTSGAADTFITSMNALLGYPKTGTTTLSVNFLYASGRYRVELTDSAYALLTTTQKASVYEDFPNYLINVASDYNTFHSKQGVQRGVAGNNNIPIALNYGGINSRAIEANFSPTGGTYSTISSAGLVQGTNLLNFPGQTAGSGTLTIRPVQDTAKSVAFTNVLVGDMYGLIGQSNMGEQATNTQSTTSKALVFNKSSRNSSWALIDGTDGTTGAGWPTFADAYITAHSIIPGMISSAIGGTTIQQWQKSSTYLYTDLNGSNPMLQGVNLYTRSLQMAKIALGGVYPKAFLWHQGEANAGTTTFAEYYTNGKQLCQDILADTGKRVIMARMEQIKTEAGASIDVSVVNAAINQLITDGYALAGPDFSDLTPSVNQIGYGSVHFTTNTEVQTQWSRWRTAVSAHVTSGAI